MIARNARTAALRLQIQFGRECGVGALWVLALGMAACGAGRTGPGVTETPMKSDCRGLPTIEECRTAAMVITDECLRGCVQMQCAGVKVNCSEYIQKECKKHSSEGISPFGFVYRTSETSCEKPVGEVNWCELPEENRECRAKAMVHELAHSCGWAHNEGLGVPSNDGYIQCD